MDLYNREIVSYSISLSPNLWQIREMLDVLFDKLPDDARPIFLSLIHILGLAKIGLTGGKDCAMDQICEVTVKAPETETFKVQEYHLPIYHYLCATLEKRCV